MTTQTKDKQTLIAIGYWYSNSEINLPRPQKFENKNIDRDSRNKLIKYLDAGREQVLYRGWSHCRYNCGSEGIEIGHSCLTDGTYIWPEGLSHYIDKHDVWLPEDFIKHAFANINQDTSDFNPNAYFNTGDFTWWTSFA